MPADVDENIQSNADKSLTAEKLCNLFYKYPLSLIPVTDKTSIKGYLSRELTLSQASTSEFFQNTLLSKLSLILIEENDEEFFEEIEHLRLSTIPMVDNQNFAVSEVTYEDFFAVYKPFKSLQPQEYMEVVNGLLYPTLLFNINGELIFKNRSVDKLFASFVAATNEHVSDILDFFPQKFYELLKNGADEMLTFKHGSAVFSFRIQHIKLEKGKVICVIFLKA